MANTGFYNPSGYNPYDDALKGDWVDGEGNQRSQQKSDDQEESRKLLQGAENNALTGGSFYRGGDSGQNDKNRNQKGKLSGLTNKKGLAVVAVILILIVGFGIFLGTTHSLLGPAISAKTLEMDTMNAAQEIEMTNTLAYLTSDEYGGELPEMLIEAFEANGIEVGDDNKTLYYNGENISGENLKDAVENNISARSAVYKTTLGQIANTLDETAINIDNNRGISKNLFVDAEQSNNLQQDLEALDEIANTKFEGQINTWTYTQGENLEYKTKSTGPGEDDWCYVNKDNNCIGGSSGEENKSLCKQNEDTHDECVLKNHTTDTQASSASTSAQTKEEAKNQASSYIEKISQNVTKISNKGCTKLRLGQVLSAQSAKNEELQSVHSYAITMETINKMMAGDGAQTYYHALMTKLTEEGTTEVANYSGASIYGSNEDDITVDVGTQPITGSAVASPSLSGLLTNTLVAASDIANFSYERTNTVLNESLGSVGITTEQCNIEQKADSEKFGANILSLFINGKDIAELITRATSISISTQRGSGTTTTSGGLAWVGTKTTSGVLGKFIKKFFVNVNVNPYIQFMAPAFGDTSYANANATYQYAELGEATVRGAYDYFSKLGQAGSGQSGADTDVAYAYNKVTNTVLARQAEADRYNRSPFDISSPNTFLGSIAYSFLPLTTTSNTTSNISSLVRKTGSSIASLSGVASAADFTSYSTGKNPSCDRLKDIKASGTNHCSMTTVTDPSILNLSHDDADYHNAIDSSFDADGNIIQDSPVAQYISYNNLRQSPPGILDENISEEVDEHKTLLQRIAQRFKSIFGFLSATYDDDKSGLVDYSSFVASESNPIWQSTYKWCSLYVLRERQLMQLGVVKYDESPLTAYIKKYEATHQPKDYTDYVAKITGSSYEDAQLALDVIAYYTFLDNYDVENRIAMEEGITSVLTSEQVAAKVKDEDQRLGSGEKQEPITLPEQEIIYDDVRNRSYIS